VIQWKHLRKTRRQYMNPNAGEKSSLKRQISVTAIVNESTVDSLEDGQSEQRLCEEDP
jgi:hypothetical protein